MAQKPSTSPRSMAVSASDLRVLALPEADGLLRVTARDALVGEIVLL
jgi:hypothetical protein